MPVLLLGSLYCFWNPCCCGSPFCCWLCDVPIVSAAVGLPPCCCRLHCFCKHPSFDAEHTVLAVLFLLSFLQLLAFLLLWAVITLLWVLLVSLLLHPDCSRHSCCCWRPLSSWWFPVAGLSAISDIPGVTNGVVRVSAVPFELAVAGGHAVTGFTVVDGNLAVASVPADPGVPILAGGFTYWIVKWYVMHYTTIQSDSHIWLSDCKFFLLSNYQNIEYHIGKFKKLSDYWI